MPPQPPQEPPLSYQRKPSGKATMPGRSSAATLASRQRVQSPPPELPGQGIPCGVYPPPLPPCRTHHTRQAPPINPNPLLAGIGRLLKPSPPAPPAWHGADEAGRTPTPSLCEWPPTQLGGCDGVGPIWPPSHGRRAREGGGGGLGWGAAYAGTGAAPPKEGGPRPANVRRTLRLATGRAHASSGGAVVKAGVAASQESPL